MFRGWGVGILFEFDPRMFYRSGWLRCVGFISIGFMLWAFEVWRVRVWDSEFELVFWFDVRCYIVYYYYYILLYIIYYIIYYTYTYILYIIYYYYYIIYYILYYTLPSLPFPSIFPPPLLFSPFLSPLSPNTLPLIPNHRIHFLFPFLSSVLLPILIYLSIQSIRVGIWISLFIFQTHPRIIWPRMFYRMGMSSGAVLWVSGCV